MRLQKPRKPRSGRRPKRGDQVIDIQIEQRLVHSRILPDENHILELWQRNAAAMSAKADNRTSKALHFQCRILTREVYLKSLDGMRELQHLL